MRKFFTNWWTITIVCAVLIALILAIGLPLFVGFLRPWWVRLLCLLLVAGGWGLLAFLRLRKSRKAADAIAAELGAPSAADEESRALAARMGEAMATLRSVAAKKRDYLYTKPWYMIVGPPGSGKTTALLNSGLQFPIGDQALKGVGGTRNLDFWFADSAVMVDTAGRYTTQDSDAAVDAKGWTSFLALLKKNRPLQPINGIIVAIGVDELIRADCAKIDAHARAVRRRMVELRKTLEVAAPVYVMLTKADLLAGFTEYYDDLDVEGRRSVLGATIAWGAGKPSGEMLAKAFDEMAQAVADRQAKRLFEEMDASRRSLLLGFPSQIQSLRSRLMRFLDGAFVAGDEVGGKLRGFYLTSGVQEGTPLDRIMSGMAEVYDRPQRAASGSGRAYFLNRLLTEVMFPEAGLVTMDPKARARQRSQLIGALAGVAVICLLTLLAWAVSFTRNRSFQNEVLTKTAEARTMVRESGIDLKEVSSSDPDLRAALPALNALRALPHGYADRQQGGAPLTMRFGLYQASLSREAEESYRDALRRMMLPRLLLRLERVMEQNKGDPLRLYEPLKVYLMLGGQRPCRDPGSCEGGAIDKAAVKSFITADWATEVYPGPDSNAERAELTRHLDALLDDPDLASVWPDRQAPLNGELVAAARTAVQTLSLADRAYALLRQKAATAGPSWEAANVLTQGDAVAFADPGKVIAMRVPYFFTRDGFDKTYTLGLATVQQDLKKDLWVFGADAEKSGMSSEMQNVRPGVAGLYAKDYIAAWQAVIDAMQPGNYFGNPMPPAFGAITKSPSPLKRVLLELAKNTSFAGGVNNAVKSAFATKLQSMQIKGVTGKALMDRTTGLSAGEEISAYFADVRQYVGNGSAPAPIDEFIAAIKAAGNATAAASAGGVLGQDATQAGMAQAMAAVQTAAATAPPQLQPFAAAAAKGGAGTATKVSSSALGDLYAQKVLPACKEVAQEHYPFFAGATQDAAISDTLRLFGMGGTMDAFVQQQASKLLDTTGPVWRWRTDDPVAATFDLQTPEQFAKTTQIRDLLAAGLPLKVSVATFGADVNTVELASGGVSYKFGRTANAKRALQWSASGVPSADVVLYGAGDAELHKYETEGPWALFRLMDQSTKENSGEKAFKATFGEGGKSVTFLIELPSETNPFSRGGPFSFRCPVTL